MHFTKEQQEYAEKIKLIDYFNSNKIPYFEDKYGKIRLVEHDSFVLSPDSDKWYWHSKGFGGIGAFQYLRKVEGKTPVEAVLILNGELNAPKSKPSPFNIRKPHIDEKTDLFVLPKKAENNNRALAYLIKTRAIDKELVFWLVNKNMIYETSERIGGKDFHNVLFIGRDENGKARYGTLRGSAYGENAKQFRRELEGSDKEYSFHFGKGTSLYVCESPIDAMSVASIHKLRGESGSQNVYLSLSGVSPAALMKYLELHKDINQLTFCLDNDEAGMKATKKLAQRAKQTFPNRKFEMFSALPYYKDFNEDLQKYSTSKSPQLIARRISKIENDVQQTEKETTAEQNADKSPARCSQVAISTDRTGLFEEAEL